MRFLRSLLYGLILVVVGLISALTAMRYAIHGREVTVPKLIGLTPAEAQRITSENLLSMARDQRFYSSDIPEGRIVSQLPLAGARVRAGFRVRVAESLGPQKVEIPNLLGQSVRSAELNLRERGLEPGSIAHLATANAAADEVIAQSPTPDAQQVSTPAVNLLTSEPAATEAFVMPDFVGSKLAEASAAIRAAGLVVGIISTAPAAPGSDSAAAQRASSANSAGAKAATKRPSPGQAGSDAIITRQTPAAGQRVFPGNTAQFEVEGPAKS